VTEVNEDDGHTLQQLPKIEEGFGVTPLVPILVPGSLVADVLYKLLQ
jgi:hypothetical protein